MFRKLKCRAYSSFISKKLIILLTDAFLIAASYFFALLVRFDFVFAQIDPQYINGYRLLIFPFVITSLALFWKFNLYDSVWSFSSFSELYKMIQVCFFEQVIVLAIIFISGIRMPISFYILGGFFSFTFTTAIRFLYRFLRMFKCFFYFNQRSKNETVKRVMVIGAGEAGRTLINEMLFSKQLNMKVCCAIDDNPNKIGKYICGVPIVGDRFQIKKMIESHGITLIIFAIPSAFSNQRKEILELCNQTNVKVQVVPGIYQLMDGEINISKLKDFSIEDLLERDPISVNLSDIHKSIHKKTVLVTGAGGSIGSEICYQIAKDSPDLLILFDIYENSVYEVQMSLKREYGDDLNVETIIGSVRDKKRIDWIMSTYNPDIVFHAAAHKHVPLMEDSPHEAIKNNVLGTYNVALSALNFRVNKFVLISSDKAVNPTSLMGASKRICEMTIQMMNRRSIAESQKHYLKHGYKKNFTSFVAVRFGNVLGSNGSVVPLFKRQIAEGGPVTITDKNITRYFMTIPEAVSLVLQASFYARGGEIFVLDMGNPVKIDDMARNLIKLSGLEPDVDIEIKYVGLRPGEKLYEELLMDEEGLMKTPNKLIYIGMPINMNDEFFMEDLATLEQACEDEHSNIKDVVAKIVPTYIPDKQHERNLAQIKLNKQKIVHINQAIRA